MKDVILNLIDEGKTTKEIMQAVHRSSTYIYKVAKQNDRKIFRRKKEKCTEKYFLSAWEEINLPNLLADASRLTISQLAHRYRIDNQTVRTYLKKLNVTPKCELMQSTIKLGMASQFIKSPAVMTDACANIYPKKQTFQRACV